MQLDNGEQTRQLRTQTIVVGNNELQLEHIGIHEQTRLQQGELVAMTARPLGTLALYGLVLRGLLSRMGEDEHVISFGFKRLRIHLSHRRRRVKVAMDGEICWMQSPLEFRVAEQPLPLLVPRDDRLRERA